MKHLKTIAAAFLAISMAGCSQDQVGPDTPTPPEDGFYSTISFKLPTTRSTQKEGDEIGQEYENKIGSILVVLATKTEGAYAPDQYKFLTFAQNDAPISSDNNTKYTITFQDKTTLYAHANSKVSVFAYCNPSKEFVDKIRGLAVNATFTDEICSTNVENTWKENGFLMTSVDEASIILPSESELKNTYNTPTNPFHLGDIPVIRTASRFDFRDSSKDANNHVDGLPALTYRILDTESPETVKPEVAKITLTRVTMFNQSNKFYFLPRTRTVGTTSTTEFLPGVAGMELNHIVTPTDKIFTFGLTKDTKLDVTSTNYKGEADDFGYQWKSLTEILGGIQDNDSEWNQTTDGESTSTKDPNRTGYYIWRYTTENTWEEAFTSNEDMIKNSTGFIFEANIVVNTENAPADYKPGVDVMYCFNNRLYPNAKAIKAAYDLAPVSALATAFEKAFEVKDDGSVAPKNGTDGKPDYAGVEEAGFIVYHPTEDGKYPCYYFAFNTHNDDGDVTQQGDMEYATVRNNVYKLAVKNIKKFGTFTPPTNIEDWDTYFDLNVLIKPWVVRVNDFEF